MKKTILILISVLAICLLAGCGKTASDDAAAGGAAGDGFDLTSIKTMGDAFAVEGKDEASEQRGTYKSKFIYVFTINNVPYRFTADLPSDIEKKIFDLEFDDDYEKNEKALVADLPISTAEDLTEQILSQDELDALAGKTGKELADMGWRGGSFYNGETKEAWLEYGPFAYSIHFDGDDVASGEDFDEIEDLADRKVLDAAYEGLGDATNID